MKSYFFWFSLLMISLTQLTYAAEEERPFIITIEIPEDNKDFFVKIKGDVNGSGASDYTIDWGDGTTTTGGSTSEETVNHTYAEGGEYQVSMSGKLPQLTFCKFGWSSNDLEENNASRVRQVVQWGTNKWYSTAYMFSYSSKLENSGVDQPDLALTQSMSYMFFYASSFNGDLSGWDVSNVKDMGHMFRSASSFNGDLSDWDVSGVTYMSFMFHSAGSFNGDLSSWDVSAVTYMSDMFYRASSFNGDLSSWDVSNVTSMGYMFSSASSFNGDLSGWDVSNVTSMGHMFSSASSFNGDLSGWDVSAVTNMRNMFRFASSFNGDLSGWDVSAVTNMSDMFRYADNYSAENYDRLLESWSKLNLQTGVNFGAPAYYCTDESLDFRQALIDEKGWSINESTQYCGHKVTFNTLGGAPTVPEAYPGIVSGLIQAPAIIPEKEGMSSVGWATSPDEGVTLDFAWDFAKDVMGEEDMTLYAKYDYQIWASATGGGEINAANVHVSPGDAFTFSVQIPEGEHLLFWELDGVRQAAQGLSYTLENIEADHSLKAVVGRPDDFIITINVPEDSKDFFVKIKGGVNGSGASDYTIDWGDGSTTTGGSSSEETVSHTYTEGGEYQVSMSGKLPQLAFCTFQGWPNDLERNNVSKVKHVAQWGTNKWYSTAYMLSFASELENFLGDDQPDLSLTQSMSCMFQYASSFNVDLSDWDVSNVKDMSHMFYRASSFNGDLSGWDVGNVTDMRSMFEYASSFNGDLSGWDVGNVTDMRSMFEYASSFNGDLSDWDVDNVTVMGSMFRSASSFNGDLSGWGVSNVASMGAMFKYASSFNGDLSNWDVSNVTYMGAMFYYARSFNGDLSGWDVSNVTNMESMFEYASSFNGDLSAWDVGNVASMGAMFNSAFLFDGDLSSWDVSNVTDMSYMFYDARSFNGDLSPWQLSGLKRASQFIRNTAHTDEDYEQMLLSWSEQDINGGLEIDIDLSYCSTEAMQAKSLLENKGWTITDQGRSCAFDEETLAQKPQGDGTEANPYLISNLAELRWLSEGLEGGLSDAERWQAETYYELSQNIDALESEIWNEGKGFAPVGNGTARFRAHFNGNGFVIQSLRINDSNTDNMGFFGSTTAAEIRNLSLIDYKIEAGTGVGAIGNAYTTSIENIKVEGYLQGKDRVGAVAGVLINSKVSSATAQVRLNGSNEVGGLVGSANYAWGAGGYSTDIRNASAHGSINASSYVGGLVGDAQNANIVNSYSNVHIKASSNVGGVVARNNAGRTAHVYASGLIEASGSNIGGVVGVNTTGLLVENAYWDKETTNQSSSAGSNASAGLTTADFQLQSNFKGWDFDNLWSIGNDRGTIRPFFQKDLIAIMVSKEGNGNIEGPLFASVGTSVTLKVIPDEGYELDQILVDGEATEWDAQNEFVIGNIQQEVQVNVRFKLRSYVVTATVNEGAKISPEEISVTHGEDQTFTLTMPEDYEVVDWKVDGLSQGHYGKDFLLENVTEQTTVEAEVVQTFAFTTDAGDHGVISPFIDRIRKGSQLSIEIYALEDYLLTDVLINGESVGAVNYYDIYPVEEAVDVKAIIVPAAYHITVSQTENGTISPETTSVAYGESQTFTITPATHHQITDVLVDGESVGAVSTYTFESVEEDHTITATYERSEFVIDVIQTDNGTISPERTVVDLGSEQTFTITPATHYQITDVLVDGESVGAVTTYTFENVEEDHTITATYERSQFVIDVFQTDNGTISPERTVVDLGSEQSFTITPATHYQIADVLVDGESVGAVSTYTFQDVEEDHTITALFDRMLSNELQTEIKFYPNPSKGQVFIEGLQTTGEVRILDLSGRVVLETKVSEVASQFDISALGTGIYQLVINGQVIGKLMKE
ncbi:BspA family leucine-rich repeat surface protein [Persicobacter sp. CCB-QB2]|uniref:BspA family leucine-rich repeat surface protein n=1 Tax=Persicobacter sp. CCB-QB2 TaxID=1561025 RepID=UPI0006A9F3BB|nr:BspA family leucine-rich repeat surface protein [Persicobacter sp. CCB-QB2]